MGGVLTASFLIVEVGSYFARLLNSKGKGGAKAKKQ